MKACTQLEWRTYRYFPYERHFAELEVENLLGVKPTQSRDGIEIDGTSIGERQIDRLTYFGKAVLPSGKTLVPLQARLESSFEPTSVGGNGSDRQRTRYSAHGLHEYRGKFNPQVVRAIGNILALPDDASVLDPFCGSGTTLLECSHVGWDAIGIDRNPLAVFIANAKISALKDKNGTLSRSAAKHLALLEKLENVLSSETDVSSCTIESLVGNGWVRYLPNFDYLEKWFSVPVLGQAAAIIKSLETLPALDRRPFLVILSDLLRGVSMQDPKDLRIRRRQNAKANYPLLSLYRQAIEDQIPRITRAREVIGRIRGQQNAIEGDIRLENAGTSSGRKLRRFDAVITSPPYATALPYIDTQRLSLCLLGLVDYTEIRSKERELVGNREISKSERGALEEAMVSDNPGIPIGAVDLCRQMLEMAKKPGNGFRRRNTPALVYRYFIDMALFFRNVRTALKPGAPVALVVGKNRTELGGKRFTVDTPALMAEVAVAYGYHSPEIVRMDTYNRYDVHQKNSINEEDLVIVRA